MRTLADDQRIFWQLITAPEGAAAGLAALPRADAERVRGLLAGDARLPALERVNIYADMYFYRLREALQENFPVLCAVVGAVPFHNLITDYLLAHPPSHFSLRYAGAQLPKFVAAHALARERRWLADLATLEAAVLDAFDAADAPPLTAASLAAISPHRWPELRFALTPSVQLLPLQAAVHDLWAAVQRGDPDPPPVCLRPTFVRVWRHDLRVFQVETSVEEHQALVAVQLGQTFADVCEILSAGSDDATARALATLTGWVDDGLLAGVTPD